MTSRDWRRLRRGGSAVIAILAIGRGIPALHAMEVAARIEAGQQQVALTRARAALTAITRSGTGPAPGPMEMDSWTLLSANSPTLASAQLARHGTAAIAASGAELGTIQLINELSGSLGFWQVAVRLQFTASVEGLGLVLADLESREPLLRIRELSIARLAPGGSAGEQRLSVVMVVEALVRPSEPSTK